MRSFVTFLTGPEFAFNEACRFASLDPRRVTVWLQRSDPFQRPVPTGVLKTERKRFFSGLEVLQLCLLGRLVETRTDFSVASLIAERATDLLAHHDKLGGAVTLQGLIELIDLGLFVGAADGREVYPAALRASNLYAEIASINQRCVDAIALLKGGKAPSSHAFVPIGELTQILMIRIAELDSTCAEAPIIKDFVEWQSANPMVSP